MDHNLQQQVRLSFTFCQGLCDEGPVISVYPDNVVYAHVTQDDVQTIIDKHLKDLGEG